MRTIFLSFFNIITTFFNTKAIKDKKECSLQLLNYKKDGSTFLNQFFLTPLYGLDKKTVAFYIGIQKEIDPDNIEKETGVARQNFDGK